MLSSEQISFWIGLILFIFSCYNFYKARARDTKNDAEVTLKTNIKLDNLCASMTETRVDIKGIVETTRKISESQIKMDQELKAVWRRIDEHAEKIELLYQHVDVYDVRNKGGE